jgi:hypothetical protein
VLGGDDAMATRARMTTETDDGEYEVFAQAGVGEALSRNDKQTK